jgi:hypothetical protein
MTRMNLAQRIVVVVGLGAALYVFGMWAMTWGSQVSRVWIATSPLSGAFAAPDVSGLHLWARLLIWLALIGLWLGAALFVFRSTNDSGRS